MTNKFDEALNNLDLLGVMMVQGVLVNRALKILHDQKQEEFKPGEKLLVPENKLIL